jgi:hypothetical protein
MINNSELHSWVIHVRARLGIPVVTARKFKRLCKCLVGHGRTSLEEIRYCYDSATIVWDDQDGIDWDGIQVFNINKL